MKRILAILLFALTLGVCQAQKVVTLSWDTTHVTLGKHATITIGDQLNLVVEVSNIDLSSQHVIFPTKEDLSRSHLELVSQSYDTVSQSGQSATVRQVNVITCFDEGEYTIDSIAVQWSDAPVYSNDVLTLKVMDVANVDTVKAEIKDIADVMREPYTFWEIFRWVLLALGVALIVVAAIFVSRRIKANKPIISLPAAPPVPDYQQALNDLEKLRVRNLWQAGFQKEYHTELTDILRLYLNRRFGIDSAEMTSDQTLEAYAERQVSQESYDRLRHILRTADMVKFAKAEPQPYEHDRSMADAKIFVEETRPADSSRKEESPFVDEKGTQA